MWTRTDTSRSGSRRAADELDDGLRHDARAGLELLEEQVCALGADCPRELRDAYDEILRMLSRTG